MVLDQIFGHHHPPLDGLLHLDDEPLVNLMPDDVPSKDFSVDLDDFQFDLDSFNDEDLDPWIQAADFDMDERFDVKEEREQKPIIDFSELDITEAVRYDCMWSTPSVLPSLPANKCITPGTGPSRQSSDLPSLPLSLNDNTLLDEFLKIMDTSSLANTEPISPNDGQIKSEANIKLESFEAEDTPAFDRYSSEDEGIDMQIVKEEDSLSKTSNQARIIASMDHCYVSSNSLKSESSSKSSWSANKRNGHRRSIKQEYADADYLSSSVDTPPESSEDEENSIHSRIQMPYNSHTINHGKAKLNQSSSSMYKTIRFNDTRIAKSLLRSHHLSSVSGGPGAKFCFRVKLRNSDRSRSVLKQRVVNHDNSSSDVGATATFAASPLRDATLASNTRLVGMDEDSFDCGTSESSFIKVVSPSLLHSSSRKRRESSLKMKHEEAREIHNQMERQRRNELKVAFDELKAHIPEIAGSDKVSKQMILDKAVENIRLLKTKDITLRLKAEKMRRSQALLRERVKLLQAELRRNRSLAAC